MMKAGWIAVVLVAAMAGCKAEKVVGSCELMPHVCMEYRGGDDMKDALKQACQMTKSAISDSGCATDKLLGTCDMPNLHTKNYYYEGAEMGADKAMAVGVFKKTCDNMGGSFGDK
jgi:hypothetical protein